MADDPIEDADNPIWTAADFAKARPASEVLPPEVVRRLIRTDGELDLSVLLHRQDRFARGWSIAA
jgi:hypothetical protein